MILSPAWFMMQPIDLEHKQYILMDYLQKIGQQLNEHDMTGLEELVYHSKSLECFDTTRVILENRNFPFSSLEEEENYRKLSSLPDTDARYKEIIRICKWSLSKIQEKAKEAGAIARRIEDSIKLFYIGQISEKNEGYVIIRYYGSDIAEVYKTSFDERERHVKIMMHNTYAMPIGKDFGDVKVMVLDEFGKNDDMFIGVEGSLSYSSTKTVIPILQKILLQNVFSKNKGMVKLGFKP